MPSVLMERLRVTHIASDDGWGGAERVLSALIPAQARRNELSVAAILLNDGPLASTLRRENVPVTIIPERGSSTLGLLRNLKAAVAGADIAHAHRYKEIALASLARGTKERLVATVHGLQPSQQMTLQQASKIWASLWLGRIRGCKFVAVSNDISLRLQRGLQTTEVVRIPNPLTLRDKTPLAVDVRTRFGWDRSRRVVLYAGRLEHVKGPDLLLQAAALLDDRIAIVFLGSGSLAEDLERQCVKHGLGSRVGFLGEVPDARSYLQQFDVLALPSRHEGFPMIVLEAAEAGLPVAAFDVGGVSELLTDPVATRLVPPGDVRELASALESIIAAAPDERTLERWRASISNRFSLDSVIESYFQLYLTCMSPLTIGN